MDDFYDDDCYDMDNDYSDEESLSGVSLLFSIMLLFVITFGFK